MPDRDEQLPLNVLGEPLEPCSFEPMTGFFRDGCCHTDDTDRGRHVVCARVTAAFLSYSMDQGNDLSTPRPGLGFPGLRPGDQWCLCARRWLDAQRAGAAPPVDLNATHQSALEVIPLELLKDHAIEETVPTFH